MTPDAKDLCVFAVKRGDITGRFDVRNLKYSQSQSGKKQEKVSLGSLTSEEPCYGTSASAIERTDESQPKYIRITDFDDFGIEDNHKFVTTENYVQKHILEIGDILFARTGGTVGKTYYYDGSIGKSVFAGYCIRFRFDDKKVLPKFIYWYTKTTAFTNWVKGIQRPSGQPNINKEEYKSFEIILPDYETQGKLCSEMDNAEIERKQKLYHANELLHQNPIYLIDRLGLTFDFSATQKITYATTVANIEGRIDADYYSPKFSHFRKQIEALPYRTVSVNDISEKIVSGFAAGKQDQADNLPEDQRVPHLRPFSISSPSADAVQYKDRLLTWSEKYQITDAQIDTEQNAASNAECIEAIFNRYVRSTEQTIFMSRCFSAEYNETENAIRRAINEINNEKKTGIMLIRVDEHHEGTTGQISDRIFRDIESAGLVIADLSSGKLNVPHEIGYAMGLKKDLILVHNGTSEEAEKHIPSNIRMFEQIRFNGDYQTLQNEIKRRLIDYYKFF